MSKFFQHYIKTAADVLTPTQIPSIQLTQPFTPDPVDIRSGSNIHLELNKPNEASTLFPNGKLRYQPTELKIPKNAPPGTPDHLAAKHENGDRKFISYAEMGDQLLNNLPISKTDFLKEQFLNRDNFLKENPNSSPNSEVLDFFPEKREELVAVNFEDNKNKRISGFYFNRHPAANDNPYITVSKNPGLLTDEMPKGIGHFKTYNGFKDNESGGFYNDPADLLTHELGHHPTLNPDAYFAKKPSLTKSYFTNLKNFGGLVTDGLGITKGKFQEGQTYITDEHIEKSQGALSFLNRMRDVTGDKLNSPERIGDLFKEIESNPAILDQIPQENARYMRQYLYLKGNGNNDKAEELKQYLMKVSPFMANNQQASTDKRAQYYVDQYRQALRKIANAPTPSPHPTPTPTPTPTTTQAGFTPSDALSITEKGLRRMSSFFNGATGLSAIGAKALPYVSKATTFLKPLSAAAPYLTGAAKTLNHPAIRLVDKAVSWPLFGVSAAMDTYDIAFDREGVMNERLNAVKDDPAWMRTISGFMYPLKSVSAAVSGSRQIGINDDKNSVNSEWLDTQTRVMNEKLRNLGKPEMPLNWNRTDLSFYD